MVSSINELDRQYRDQLVVIGLDADESTDVVRAFVDQHELAYLNLIAGRETLLDYRVRAHPFTLLVTSEGQVYRTYLGYTDKAVMEEDIRTLLGIG